MAAGTREVGYIYLFVCLCVCVCFYAENKQGVLLNHGGRRCGGETLSRN